MQAVRVSAVHNGKEKASGKPYVAFQDLKGCKKDGQGHKGDRARRNGLEMKEN